MATAMKSPHDSDNASDSDGDSDYGYDLSAEDEQLLFATVARSASSSRLNREAPEHILNTDRVLDSTGNSLETDFTTAALSKPRNIDNPLSHYSHAPALLSTPKGKVPITGITRTDSVGEFAEKTTPRSTPTVNPVDDISFPDLGKTLSQLPPEVTIPLPPEPESSPDTRSPLLRFRTFPKKPLSVSDLTAGAWCELQYEYTLTFLPGGKKTRTAAMKEGTKIHKALEDEVHETVQVEITTKEDVFGLKLWNIIQGLRTLRETGLTRELEVWGLVDGNVVNGLIDGLSYQNPDPESERQPSGQDAKEEPDQQKITAFFPQSQETKETKETFSRRIYLVDVKTRYARTLPEGPQLRPTKVQLFLYHRFLSDMASGQLDFIRVFRRYGLDPEAEFSDSFIAQIGNLHDEVFVESQASSIGHSHGSDSSMKSPDDDSVRYGTLRQLTSLVQDELQLTFPHGAHSVGPLVTVEYRSRRRKSDESEESAEETQGRIIGKNVMPVDHKALDIYLKQNMQWWQGERLAKGVDIEEANKCRSCEFNERCTWRRDIDEGNLRRVREKLAARAGQPEGSGQKSPRRRRTKSLVTPEI